MSREKGGSWPTEPLIAELRAVPVHAVAEKVGVSQRTVTRWRGGEPIGAWWVADRVATMLGLHPAMVWTEWPGELAGHRA